ncbi:MAG TPA: hypothetical protein VMU89_23130 [Thermomicrobiaceae bacterium]|nr:hypothetical protein [Thermomicrobiaceae bacterium]
MRKGGNLYRTRQALLLVALAALLSACGWPSLTSTPTSVSSIPPSPGQARAGITRVTTSRASTAAPTPTPTPTPIPTPTPTPVPPPLPRCYQPRPAAVQASPVASPEATPGVTPTPTPIGLSPAGPRSLFQNCQIVAFYGYPDVPAMGVLGSADPAPLVQKLEAQVAAYQKVNTRREIAPALELIYAVAQDSPGDGTYLARMPDSMVQQYLALAEKDDLLVILDIQMGHSTVAAELPHVLPYLKNPRVHLALDPEFHTPGDVPGTVIGSMDASEINRAADALQQLVDQYHLPNKILIVHQFRPEMIQGKSDLKEPPGVDLVIDMDGFGGQEVKISEYEEFVKGDGAPHGGFKLFYTQDKPLLTPDQVEQLDPQPDVVIYQ